MSELTNPTNGTDQEATPPKSTKPAARKSTAKRPAPKPVATPAAKPTVEAVFEVGRVHDNDDGHTIVTARGVPSGRGVSVVLPSVELHVTGRDELAKLEEGDRFAIDLPVRKLGR